MSQVRKSNFLVFDRNTGKALYQIRGQGHRVVKDANHYIAKVPDTIKPETMYLEPETLTVKTRKAFTHGAFDGQWYNIALPVNTRVSWQGESYLCEDGVLELLVDQPGKHILYLSHPHYLDAEITIESQ